MENFEFENEYQLFVSAELAIMFTLGEVNYKKHIADFEVKQISKKTNGFLQLSELPEFIEYLSKINYSRKLKIFFEYENLAPFKVPVSEKYVAERADNIPTT